MAILNDVKLAVRIANTDTEFDSELTNLIQSAMLDLCIAGVNGIYVIDSNPLVKTAIITYCKMHFGQPDDFDRLKKSYDEQKSQMSMASGYTVWGGMCG